MTHRILRTSPVALVAAGLVLVGCTSEAPSQTSSETTSPAVSQTMNTSLPPSAATTIVSAPDGGNISSTAAAPATSVSALPGDFGKTVQPRTGVRLVIDSVVATTVTARGPGEVTGPGVVVQLSVANDSGEAVPLTSATVTVTDAKNLPAVGMSGPPADPLPGQLPAGQSVRGVYVFRLPPDSSEPLRVTVSLGQPGVPVVMFTGSPS